MHLSSLNPTADDDHVAGDEQLNSMRNVDFAFCTDINICVYISAEYLSIFPRRREFLSVPLLTIINAQHIGLLLWVILLVLLFTLPPSSLRSTKMELNCCLLISPSIHVPIEWWWWLVSHGHTAGHSTIYQRIKPCNETLIVSPIEHLSVGHGPWCQKVFSCRDSGLDCMSSTYN